MKSSEFSHEFFHIIQCFFIKYPIIRLKGWIEIENHCFEITENDFSFTEKVLSYQKVNTNTETTAESVLPLSLFFLY